MNFKKWFVESWNDGFWNPKIFNQEAMVGNTFVAYHRTNRANAEQIMATGRFILEGEHGTGGDRVYGEGVYFALTLADWRKELASQGYGDWIVAASIHSKKRIVNAYTGSFTRQLVNLGVDLDAFGIKIGQSYLPDREVINKISQTGKVDGFIISGKASPGGWLVLFKPELAKPQKVAFYRGGNEPIRWQKQMPPATQWSATKQIS